VRIPKQLLLFVVHFVGFGPTFDKVGDKVAQSNFSDGLPLSHLVPAARITSQAIDVRAIGFEETGAESPPLIELGDF
jgi:hypothetical protein